jgi:hypothetical protein
MPGGRFAGPKPGEIHFGHHRPAFGGQCLLADVGVLPRGTKNLLPATVLMVAAPAIVWLAYVVRQLLPRRQTLLQPAVPKPVPCILTGTRLTVERRGRLDGGGSAVVAVVPGVAGHGVGHRTGHSPRDRA